MKNNLLALLAALAGGCLGHLGFVWAIRQGFYAIVLPGALVGLSASLFPARSVAVPVACGVFALAAGVYSEWSVLPFARDPSLGYFLQNLHQLKPVTLALIALGTAIGFWIPFSNSRRLPPQARAASDTSGKS